MKYVPWYYTEKSEESMSDNQFSLLNSGIQTHLKLLCQKTGLDASEENLNKLAEGWLKKENAFNSQMDEYHLQEVDEFARISEHACIVLTLSGSLLRIAELETPDQFARLIEYTSIGQRTDVPLTSRNLSSVLHSDIHLGEVIEFDQGPVKKTSPAYRIAVARSEDGSKNDALLEEVTKILSDEFLQINMDTLIIEKDDQE
jgi:hypothetical protein